VTARLDLARLRTLHPTVAPWGVAAGGHRVVAVDEHGKERGGLRVGHYPHIANVARPDDAELMAAAPALLERLERAEVLLRDVHAELYGFGVMTYSNDIADEIRAHLEDR
jgi:hypothetical protein